jgi:hypothetical protein
MENGRKHDREWKTKEKGSKEYRKGMEKGMSERRE